LQLWWAFVVAGRKLFFKILGFLVAGIVAGVG